MADRIILEDLAFLGGDCRIINWIPSRTIRRVYRRIVVKAGIPENWFYLFDYSDQLAI